MIDDLVPIKTEMEGRTVRVYAVADVHIGSRQCDLEGFSAFLRKLAADHDAFMVVCGDMFDNAIIGSPGSMEQTMGPQEAIETCAELLRPVADKVLALVGGNHEARSRKAVDMSPLYAVCCILGIQDRYRESMAFLRISMRGGKGKMRRAYDFLLMHGKTANKKRQFTVEGVDVFVTGHTHDGLVEMPRHIRLTHNGAVMFVDVLHVTATSWLNFGGYASSAMYSPKVTSRPQAIELVWANSNNAPKAVRVVW